MHVVGCRVLTCGHRTSCTRAPQSTAPRATALPTAPGRCSARCHGMHGSAGMSGGWVGGASICCCCTAVACLSCVAGHGCIHAHVRTGFAAPPCGPTMMPVLQDCILLEGLGCGTACMDGCWGRHAPCRQRHKCAKQGACMRQHGCKRTAGPHCMTACGARAGNPDRTCNAGCGTSWSMLTVTGPECKILPRVWLHAHVPRMYPHVRACGAGT